MTFVSSGKAGTKFGPFLCFIVGPVMTSSVTDATSTPMTSEIPKTRSTKTGALRT
jgi:hypothetical protein